MLNTKTNFLVKEHYDIAIIGGGASSVVMLKSILRHYCSEQPFNIILFSDSKRLGPGSAYQKDVNSALLNRPLHAMSIDKHNVNDAMDWLQKNKHYIKLCYDEGDKGLYMPRWVFGKYLEDRMLHLIEVCKAKNINVKVIYDKVTDIYKIKDNTIQSEYYPLVSAQYVVFCCGHNAQRDIYNLKSTKNYVHNPYPLVDKVNTLPKVAKIAIIGSSLTAIDIALSLHDTGHHGGIDLLSRNHTLPYIRGPVNQTTLQYMTDVEIDKIIQKQQKISIRDMARLLKLEMDAIGYDWKKLFKNDHQSSLYDKLSSEIAATDDSERKWQSALISTNGIIEKIWCHMSETAKQYFLENYNRAWLNSRSPIPITNARKLLQLLGSGQMHYRSGLNDLRFNQFKGVYEADVAGEHLNYDIVINATGPSNNPLTTNALLRNLINKGRMKLNPWGGIDVNYMSGQVIDANNRIDKHQYMVGQNTSGVYYYTTSLEMIVNKCDSVANHLVSALHENKKVKQNNENKTNFSAHNNFCHDGISTSIMR